MQEELRKVPFECRSCRHVWAEEYLVRQVAGRNGGEVWLRGGVQVPPPSASEMCPNCGCHQSVRFPEGYLDRHPELTRPARPDAPDPTPLISPVRKRERWLPA